MDAKQLIRQQMIAQRNALTTETVKQKSSAIAQKVFMLPEYIEADHVLLYADYRHEVMTKEIFDDAILRKKKVYFPKCNPKDSTMEFYQVVSIRQLMDGYKGIKEPIAIVEHQYFHPSKHRDLQYNLSAVLPPRHNCEDYVWWGTTGYDLIQKYSPIFQNYGQLRRPNKQSFRQYNCLGSHR